MVKLDHEVRFVKTEFVGKLGIGDFHHNDKMIIEEHLLKVQESFLKDVYKSSNILRMRSFFPTQLDEDSGKGLVFIKTGKSTVMYTSKKHVIQHSTLPKVFSGRLSVCIKGVRTKESEFSFVVEIHQLKIAESKVSGVDECIFISSDEDDAAACNGSEEDD